MGYRQDPNTIPDSSGVTPELRAIEHANPAVELQKSIRKHDLRFLGVDGYGRIVPGVPCGGATTIVRLQGTRGISGTSDFIRSREQGRLQHPAAVYAEKYNALLYKYLLKINAPSVRQTRQKIDEELLRLEKKDPIADARKSVKEAPPLTLIELFDITDGYYTVVPGVNPDALDDVQFDNSLKSIGIRESIGLFANDDWPTIFDPGIMTPLQRARLTRQIKRYIEPYNRYVFAHHRPFLEKLRAARRNSVPKKP